MDIMTAIALLDAATRAYKDASTIVGKLLENAKGTDQAMLQQALKDSMQATDQADEELKRAIEEAKRNA